MKTQIIGIALVITALTSLHAVQPVDSGKQNESLSVVIHSATDLIQENITEYQGEAVTLNGIELNMAPLVYRLFELNSYKPIWSLLKNKQTTDQVLQVMQNAHYFGIDPGIFDIDYISFIRNDIEKQKKTLKKSIRITQFEFLLSNALFQYIVLIDKGYKFIDDMDFANQGVYMQTLPGEVFEAINENLLIEILYKRQHLNSNISDNLEQMNAAVLLFKFIKDVKFDTRKMSNDALNINIDRYIETMKDDLSKGYCKQLQNNYTKHNAMLANYIIYKSRKQAMHSLSEMVYHLADNIESKKQIGTSIALY